MGRKLLLTGLFIATFALGFAVKTFTSTLMSGDEAKKKATGIGGVFFKCKNPALIRDWYKDHLGLNVNEYGAVFEWRQGADSTKKGFTQWSPFSEKTKYFAPSSKDFMINYRVENLRDLVAQLSRDSVVVLDKIDSVDYGKFVHIMDPEGNKIELWEPVDEVYAKMGEKMGAKTTK